MNIFTAQTTRCLEPTTIDIFFFCRTKKNMCENAVSTPPLPLCIFHDNCCLHLHTSVAPAQTLADGEDGSAVAGQTDQTGQTGQPQRMRGARSVSSARSARHSLRSVALPPKLGVRPPPKTNNTTTGQSALQASSDADEAATAAAKAKVAATPAAPAEKERISTSVCELM